MNSEYHHTVDWSAIAGLTDIDSIIRGTSGLLEDESFSSSTDFDALNRPVELTSPDNSVTQPRYNEANLLEGIEANLHGSDTPIIFVKNIDYDAKGQRTRIECGNGVVTGYEYDPLTFRLTRLHTTREANLNGLAALLFNNADTVQDLRYTYDPAGNITRIADEALTVIHHDDQPVEPIGSYTYDALYRLIDARGREHIGQSAFQDNPPNGNCRDYPLAGLGAQANDTQAVRNYTEQYLYDEVGNFLSFNHQANGGSWQRDYTYEELSLLAEPGEEISSNRLTLTILHPNGAQPVVEPYAYDAHGNMTQMPHLPLMQWDFNDQLSASSQQVRNDGGTPEITYYVYDAGGQRVRKVTERQAAEGETPTRMKERIYLGGFEIYREYDGSGATCAKERETLHVMDDQQRIALVDIKTLDEGTTAELNNPVIRYQLGNHLGSASLELDRDGAVISYEEYHPYGTTSYQAGRSLAEISLKRYRYTGMERDQETGFNYHGARYYAGWLGRWTQCDPLGLTDGLNLYCYSNNSPIIYSDKLGTQTKCEEGTSCQPESERQRVVQEGEGTNFISGSANQSCADGQGYCDAEGNYVGDTLLGERQKRDEQTTYYQITLSTNRTNKEEYLRSVVAEKDVPIQSTMSPVDMVTPGTFARVGKPVVQVAKRAIQRAMAPRIVRIPVPQGPSVPGIASPAGMTAANPRFQDLTYHQAFDAVTRDRLARLHSEWISLLKKGPVLVPQEQRVIVRYLRQLTGATGKEVSLFQMQSGRRFLVLGQADRMGLPFARNGTFQIGKQTFYPKKLIAHTHPSGNLELSGGDINVMQRMGQTTHTVVIGPTLSPSHNYRTINLD